MDQEIDSRERNEPSKGNFYRMRKMFGQFISLIKGRIMESEEHLSDPKFILNGFLKGVLLWGIPLVVFARRKREIRRAIAIGLGVALVRFLSRLADKNQDISSYYYKNAVIGLIAGPIFLILDGNLHQNSVLVFWILIRAFYNVVPSIPLGSTIVMCLSASQLLSSWIFAPPTQLNKSFRSFLNWQGGQLVDDINFYQRFEPPGLNNACFLIHPDSSCGFYSIHFFLSGLYRALRLYLPLYGLLFITSQKKSIYHLLENLVRSCFFLSAYCTLGWASACVYYKIKPEISRKSLAMHTWISGLAVLLERPGRRSELAIYCLTYAMDSLYRWYKETYKESGFQLPTRLLLVLSGSILFHHHLNQPSFVMKWLLQLKD